MTRSDTAGLVAELRSVSEWLKSLHHLHPTPTHLELNLAKHSVDKAIESLSTPQAQVTVDDGDVPVSEMLAVTRLEGVRIHLKILETQFSCGGPIPPEMTDWLLRQVRAGIAEADRHIAETREDYAALTQPATGKDDGSMMR